MKKNIRQTLSILLSIILSVGMIVAVSCLMYSAHENSKQSIREQNGDYHYALLGDSEIYANVVNSKDNYSCKLLNTEVLDIKDSLDVTENFNIVLSYAADDCRKMTNRSIIKGEYPENTNEIALDRNTLRLLNVKEEIGKNIEINDETFILSGIINDPVDISGETKEAFVCREYPDSYDLYKIFLKFDESKDFYEQVLSFCENNSIDPEQLRSNGELIDCIIDGNIQRFVNIVRSVHEDEEANFITFLMRLKSEMHLTTGVVSFLLVIFSIFIIYSIFSVSISKRMKEYSILQTIGVSRNMICLMLMIEMYFLLLIGYPLGILSGIMADKVFFSSASDIFSGKASLLERTHTGSDSIKYTVSESSNNLFYIDRNSMISCAVLIAVLIIGMCIIISVKINRMTVKDMMNSEKNGHRKEKIYSLKHRTLINALTNRFIFAVPAKFIMIVISMSLGCLLILSINFVASNTRMNNEMIMHSQEGLSSDIKISADKEEDLDEGITSLQYDQINNTAGVRSVSGFMYNLGEIRIEKDLLHWKEYWPEIADDDSWKPSPEVMNRFNGIVTEDSSSYRIKTNIYGYDEKSLDDLNNYVIEGKIDSELMEKENGIILRTLIDAQNNHDGLDISVGDIIHIKTVKEHENNKELLRFDGSEEKYEEKKFKVTAIVNTSIVSNTEYIKNAGLDIIMTNDMMRNNYDIDSYNILAVNKENKNDELIAANIQKIISEDNNINLYDNTIAIKTKNEEIRRSEILIYSIAVLLMIIAVFNIINTISHLLDSKRYSFAVLRAIGITKRNFYKMLGLQAVKYTLATFIVIVAAEILIQHVLGNSLIHVYGYINHIQNVPIGLFLLIFAGIGLIFTLTVTVIGKQILNSDIIEELKTD